MIIVQSKEPCTKKRGQWRQQACFSNPKTGLPYEDVKKSFNKAKEEAVIKDFRFHDLRHTAAARPAEKGIDLLVVMDIRDTAKQKQQ